MSTYTYKQTMSTYTYKWIQEDHSAVARYGGGIPSLGIPADPANTDYQAFLAWCEEGNTPEPYAAPTVIDGIEDLATAKGIASDSVRSTAYSLLQPTDWVVVREAETGVEAPADITSFRESVRTASASKIATIESKTDLESLKAYLRSDEYKNWPEQ